MNMTISAGINQIYTLVAGGLSHVVILLHAAISALISTVILCVYMVYLVFYVLNLNTKTMLIIILTV